QSITVFTLYYIFFLLILRIHPISTLFPYTTLFRSLGDHHLRARPGVGRLPHEHLVQHARETVHVAPPVDRPAPAGLLGAHVCWRADGDARLRQPRPRRLRDRACDPEVRHHRLTPRQQDILRFDVAVHHVVAV